MAVGIVEIINATFRREYKRLVTLLKDVVRAIWVGSFPEHIPNHQIHHPVVAPSRVSHSIAPHWGIRVDGWPRSYAVIPDPVVARDLVWVRHVGPLFVKETEAHGI